MEDHCAIAYNELLLAVVANVLPIAFDFAGWSGWDWPYLLFIIDKI